MTEKRDNLDIQIIEALESNARSTTVEIGRRLGVPRTTVVERMRRLERDGVILGYTVRINPDAADRGQAAFALVRLGPGIARHSQETGAQISTLAGVEEVHAVAGDWDLVIKTRTRDLAALYDLLENMGRLPGVHRTSTLTSFGSIKEAS